MFGKTYFGHDSSELFNQFMLCSKEEDYRIPCVGREFIWVEKDQAAIVLKNNCLHKSYSTTDGYVKIPLESDVSGYRSRDKGFYHVVWFNLGVIRNLHAACQVNFAEDCMKNIPGACERYVLVAVDATVSCDVRIKDFKRFFTSFSEIADPSARFNLSKEDFQEHFDRVVSRWMKDWISEHAGAKSVHEVCVPSMEQAITHDLKIRLQKGLNSIGLELVEINNRVRLRPCSKNFEILDAERRKGIRELNQMNLQREHGSILKDLPAPDLNTELKHALINYLNMRTFQPTVEH